MLEPGTWAERLLMGTRELGFGEQGSRGLPGRWGGLSCMLRGNCSLSPGIASLKPYLWPVRKRGLLLCGRAPGAEKKGGQRVTVGVTDMFP